MCTDAHGLKRESFKRVTPSKAAGNKGHTQVFDFQGAAVDIQRWN